MFRKAWSRFIVCVALLTAIVPSMMAIGASAATDGKSDLEGHWAEQTFVKWLDREWINGYPDGTYRPDAPIKRAEFVAMVNRTFGFTAAAEKLPFTDLTKNHWAYTDIAIAYENEYFRGTGSHANADKVTTRQEGAVMIANALGLELPATADLSKYSDEAFTADWARSALATLSEKSIFKGDTKGNIRSADVLTRAEAITVIEAALPYLRTNETFDEAGVYGSETTTQTIDGDVTITAHGVTLLNTVITGDLLLAESIGEGDVTLKNVDVKGTVTVQGGGENSVHVEDSVFVKIIVDKADGKVRIVASGATKVESIIVESQVKLDTTEIAEGSGINLVELSSSLPANSSVDFLGRYDNVRIMATDLQINVPSGSIGQVEVGEGSSNNKINLGQEASIADLILNAVAMITGQGKIETATVNSGAVGSQFEKQPDKLEEPGQASPPPVVNPGGGGGGGIVTPPADDQTKAGLSSITINPSVNLVQRDAMLRAVGAGFNKEVLHYTVSVDRDIEPKQVSITVAPESNAADIEAIVYYEDLSSDEYPLTVSDRTFEVNLTPREDAHAIITVTSGNKSYIQSYRIDFQYERTIQEAFTIRRSESQAFYGERVFYSIYSQSVFEEGDVVEVYGASTDATPLLAEAVESFGFLYSPLTETSYELLEQGNLYIKVKRNGVIIDEGNFAYDLTELTRINDSQGTLVNILTQDEVQDLIEDGLRFYEPYVIHIDFDPTKWSGGPLEHATYYELLTSSTSFMYPEILAPMRDEHILGFNPYDINKSRVTSDAYYDVTNYGYDEVNDLFVQIIYYDENYNPLGYYEQIIEPLDEHVKPGYRIVHTVRPELNTADRVKPVIESALPPYVSPGDELQIAVSEASNVYIVPFGTSLEQGRAIHELVRSGTGAGDIYFEGTAFVGVNTSRLTEGNWIVVAVDKSGNISDPIALEVVDQEDIALNFDHFIQDYNTGVLLNFIPGFKNNLESLDALKQNISISRDGGKTYEALGEGDTVSIYSNMTLFIHFAHPYSGDMNRIKINENSLANENGVVMNRDWVSPLFAAGTVIDMISRRDIEAGDAVVFTADRAAKVYLIPVNVTGSDFDRLVQEGKAKSVTIDQNQAGQQITLSTEGLAPGRYLLFTIQGTVTEVNISLSPPLSNDQIEIVKNETEQSVTVTELKAGDIVRLYLNPVIQNQNLIKEVTVPSGQNSIVITDLDLDAYEWIFFTVQEPGKSESSAIVITYSSIL